MCVSDDCRYGVFKQFMNGLLECHCPERCWYDMVMFSSVNLFISKVK